MEILRDDIQIIARNSTISETDINLLFKEEVYRDKKSWQQFLQLFFISIGVSFTVAGILFFFAYNWDDLHKFVKIGLVEGLIIVLTLVAVFTKIKPLFKDIILAGATMLVGVLFAVFGQIYQTGANAYDFFLGWTMAVTLWVVVSNFAVLWLILIVLINVTLGLYIDQVAQGWTDLYIFSIFIIINSIFLLASLFLKYKKYKIPEWFIKILSLTVVGFTTSAMINGIFEHNKSYFALVILLTLALYISGIYYALKQKSTFYIAIISLSVITIISAWLVDFVKFREFTMLLFIGLFVVVSVTIVIKLLMNLQKQWKNEK